MKKDIKNKVIWFLLFCTSTLFAQTTINSISELAEAAANSNQNIVMSPGVYQMTDYLTQEVKDNNTPADEFGRRAMIRFSGSNNIFDFTGVTINIDTELLNDLGRTVIEFHLTGSDINFKGLTVTDIGNSPTAGGGQSMTISGDNITVENVTLNMSGSSPYGYGDLLGKGGGSLAPMRKHSGLLVGGLNVSVIGCKIYSTSFGHLFFVQGGRNVLFQDCYAEAVTRTTDEMLAETSGPAFDVDFQAVYPNYNGENVITSGYTKSLSECGFRTYGEGAGNITEGVSLINCIARNTRVGFALEIGSPILVQNCEATGNEAGFNVKDVTIENSRGDAVNGPLLYLSGDDSEVELELMDNLPTTTLHAVATIAGNNHKVTFKKWNNQTRTQEHKILIGATRPTGTNPFSPLGSSTTSSISLNNCTEMPVEILSNTSSSVINTTGSVTDNGSGNTVITDSCEGIEDLNFNDGTYQYRILGTEPNECELIGFVSNQEKSTVTIPNQVSNGSLSFNVVSVGVDAFKEQTIITSVSLPSSVTNIANNAFIGCTGLVTINLENIITYGEHSFNGCNELVLSPLNFTNTTSVGNYCFMNCNKITSVVVPGTVTLGVGALRSTGITSFKIPDEWTVLPDQMIRDCKSVTTVNIPSTITTMGVAAFRGCTGITDIQVNWSDSNNIPPFVSNLFSGLTLENINLLVPQDTVDIYNTADGWKDFNIVAGALSIKDILSGNLDIQVSADVITLNSSATFNNANITIYDITGKVLANQVINGATAFVNISNLTTGIYVVKVTQENAKVVKRFAKY